MRHHNYVKKIDFCLEPLEFDKYTDIETLKYCLGATMYMPGTKDFHDAIVTKKYPGLTSMVMCFEDACREEDVPAAEENVLKLLDRLADDVESGALDKEDIPLLIVRVRNQDQFLHFSDRLTKRRVSYLTGFNFPKFEAGNGEEYYDILAQLNRKYDEILYGMPILESRKMAYLECRNEELLGVKEILDRYHDLVLNVRVGGTDWSSVFGARRGINHTIYDVLPVADCLKDVLNFFSRNNDYTISGPVWEYFRANRAMKFSDIPNDVNESIFKTKTYINDAVDGLLKEVMLDQANGFIGKTIIHPSHIPYVNGMYAVTEEVYNDAIQIINTDGGVIKSENSNKMNEIGPHRKWAEKMYERARVYGVIKDESSYVDIFKAGAK